MTRRGIRSRFTALALLLALVSFLASLALAQEAVVTRNVNLRRDPSTSQPPIRLLIPPDTVELLEPDQTSGYYHIRTEDREEGWVWGRNLRVLSEGEPSPTSPQTAPAPVPSGDGTTATAVAPDWEKPTPNQTTFTSEGNTCGPSGDGGDTPTNLLKNRTDVPGEVHDVTWDAIARLPFPSPAPKHRSDWTADQLAVIRPYEGIAVRVIGYLVALKPQTNGSGESTNCHWTKSGQVDWHMALVKSVGDGEKDAIVVETTPRVRQLHPKWTPTRLPPWVNTDAPIRITGWLMFDPEHTNHLGKYRTSNLATPRGASLYPIRNTDPFLERPFKLRYGVPILVIEPEQAGPKQIVLGVRWRDPALVIGPALARQGKSVPGLDRIGRSICVAHARVMSQDKFFDLGVNAR